MPHQTGKELPSFLSAPRLCPPQGWWESAFTLRLSPSEAAGHRCGHKQMLTIIAYDITDPKRLHKVAKLCEDYGMRIQYSVFECRLEADRFEAFWDSLVSLIDPSSDRVTAYKVCASCSKNILDAGVQMHSEKAIAYVF
jgi:CRISPR-associated protein Cas2